MKIRTFTSFALGLAATSALAQGSMDNCPMNAALQASEHAKGVDSRGDKAMGFSHEATKHHFLLYGDGGAIEVVTNSAKDMANRDMIRTHLKMIAGMFSAGNFELPMFIHKTNVPGTANMKRLRKQIRYTFAELPSGGEVRITTANRRAIEAIHNFLRFQIRDHRTGDTLEISR